MTGSAVRVGLRAGLRAAVLAGAAAAVLAGAAAATAQTIEVYTSADPKLSLGTVGFEGGKTLDLSVGIGSGLFRAPDDPPGVFWAVGDRGPNFTCGDAKAVIGLDGKAFCGDVPRGRIYPRPDYSPSIYRIRIDGPSTFAVDAVIPLRQWEGEPVTGLLNPLTAAATETPLDADRRVLPHDPAAVDAEGIVRLSDGHFWIGEENGPSLLYVAPDGTIRARIVPAGENGFAGANYAKESTLPAILSRRALNRGIESMAVSGDESTLYFILQNPLANPDDKTYRDAANTRLFAMDRRSGRLLGEYVYVLSPMAGWAGEESKPRSTLRISELLWLAPDTLLVDERTEKTTKLYRVDLAGATDILGTRWDDPATAPGLEAVTAEDAGIVPVAKTLVFDTTGRPEIPTKIEGLAIDADGALVLLNDDDFGITGERTKLVKVRGLALGK